MVILTKLIISNIKNIKSNYIFFDLDLDFIFEDEDIYKTDFDNDFIQKIINVYTNRKNDDEIIEDGDELQKDFSSYRESLLDEIFGKFLKKIKDYLDYLEQIENNIIDLNKFFKKEYICTDCIDMFYKLDKNDKLQSDIFESTWY
jgi:hypothetical protein